MSWGRHLGPEVVGAAILDLTSWGPPSWTGSRGGRHLGPEVTSLALKWHLYYSTGCDEWDDGDDFSTEPDTMIDIVYEDDLDEN